MTLNCNSLKLLTDIEKLCAKVDFHGTGIEILAGFGPIWQLLRLFFSYFYGQKKNFKNIL